MRLRTQIVSNFSPAAGHFPLQIMLWRTQIVNFFSPAAGHIPLQIMFLHVKKFSPATDHFLLQITDTLTQSYVCESKLSTFCHLRATADQYPDHNVKSLRSFRSNCMLQPARVYKHPVRMYLSVNSFELLKLTQQQ